MDKKWTKYILPLLGAAVVLGGLVSWGLGERQKQLDYKAYMDNLYSKSYYELVGHVENIQTNLEKLAVSGDPEQNWILLSSVWRHADSAQQNLGQLPELGVPGSDMSKYLNQVSDFCKTVMDRLSRRQPIDVENQEVLDTLLASCVTVAESFAAGQPPQGETALSDRIEAPYQAIQQTSIEYPHIIYDGPFSETRLETDLAHFKGKEVDAETARRRLQAFLGDGYTIERGIDTQGDIATWGFTATPADGSGQLICSISVIGGRVLTVLWDGQPPQAVMDEEAAYQAAIDLVAEKGLRNMVPQYRQREEGMLLVTFAYRQGEVLCYADQVKVQVSLKDGSLMGWEATNYYLSHHAREIPEPELTVEEAEAMLRQGLTVLDRQLAMIPLPTGKEVLCYEFKVDNQGQTYLIYINAITGHEEEIFKLLENENGMLIIKDGRSPKSRL